jgi:predicted ATP-grasp superfamily ATP-dependent carboligase
MRILVTDGETRAALAAVRALGARGHSVHAVTAGPHNLAGASRFAASEHRATDPSGDPKGWTRAIEQLARDLGVELLLPVSDVSLGTLYAFGVEERLPVAGPTREAHELAVDKHALLERASRLGLDCPCSVLIQGSPQLEELPPTLRFPVVLKPRRTCLLTGGRWVKAAVRILRTPDDLRAAREDAAHGDALLQEFVPGHGEGIFLLAREGRTLVSFAHRRLREKPPTGGTSVLCESIAPDPELLERSSRLLESLCWTGVAMIEFRRSPTGRVALMEVNPRLWGSLQLAIDAGVDFPSLLVDLHRGAEIPPVEPRLGVRSRWLLGDLDHLLISLRSRSTRRATGQRLLPLLGAFLRSFVDGSRTDVLRWNDPRPFARELRGWIRDLGPKSRDRS